MRTDRVINNIQSHISFYRKGLFLAIFIFVLSGSLAYAQQWARTYGGANNDQANSVYQTSDGGYIVAGCTYSYGAGNGDLWVLKFNADGSLAWQKTYGGINKDCSRSIQRVKRAYLLIWFLADYPIAIENTCDGTYRKIRVHKGRAVKGIKYHAESGGIGKLYKFFFFFRGITGNKIAFPQMLFENAVA